MKKAVIAFVVCGLLALAWWGQAQPDTRPRPVAPSGPISTVVAAPGDAVTAPPVAASTGTVGSSSTSAGTASEGARASDETPVPAQRLREAQAMNQAAQFMQAYARPAAGPDTFAWWQTVQVFLVLSAMKALKVDPSKVPFTSVTGMPVLAGTAPGAKSPATADVLVNVPTNHGKWRVRLTDQASGESMLVVAASPVEAAAHSTSR